MQLACTNCGHSLSYEGSVPRFCSNCGKPLSQAALAVTIPPGTQPDPQATIVGPTPRAVEEHPSSVGGYKLVRKIGGGGMGTVFEATEEGSDRLVAVKLIRPEFANSPDAVERFRREGRLASCINHPRCVFVLAADEQAGSPYIVMELMPGRTLHDLMNERGRLPVGEAVSLILDVIEGLQEAHRRGVIHRDIKPSNCFLDHDGRVKVGDFGLAKSLVAVEMLTRTGAFLGTLLFAAPEQIRNDKVGAQTDVYSVCATLYYLLTGVAPFQGPDNDPAATLARTVSDPLTPMRKHRPELPRALDDIVCKGLARSRSRRYADLESLRLALAPFVEVQHTADEVAWRVGAGLGDMLVLIPLEVANEWVLANSGMGQLFALPLQRMLATTCFSLIIGLLYFGIAEYLFGCTPGKFLARLRVREIGTGDRPSWWRAGLRTLVFYLAQNLLLLIGALLIMPVIPTNPFSSDDVTVGLVLAMIGLSLLPLVSVGLGLAILAFPMRKSNAYRGLHELLSGTETIRIPEPRPTLKIPEQSASEGVPPGVPTRVGTFGVRTVIRFTGDEWILVCADPALDRPVWLWVRASDNTTECFPTLARETRPRWLAGGIENGQRFDAFVAVPGCLLADLAVPRRPLRWAETLPLLAALAEELETAQADGTLPATLGVMQIWVQPSGRPLLLDMPMREGPEADTPLRLLAQVAALALEGRASDGRSIHAPLPSAASALLDRLTGQAQSFVNLAELRQELAASQDQPTEISRPRRGIAVAIGILALLPGLVLLFALGPALLVMAYGCTLAGQVVCESNLENLEQVPPPDYETQVADYTRLHAELGAGKVQVLRSFSGGIRSRLVPEEQHFRNNYAKLVQEAEFDDLAAKDRLFLLGDELLAGPRLAVKLAAEYGLFWVLLVFLGVPSLWCIWSALTRGGFAISIMGIRLRDRQGRPASRWRCLLRSAWMVGPVVILLMLSFWLDVWRLSLGPEFSFDSAAAWVAWWAWWQALVLLVAYVGIALAWPNRTLHDWLAGTYPVPG